MQKQYFTQNTVAGKKPGLEASESLWERIEKAYKTSERRYRLLAENISDVIWTINADERFTYISPSVYQLRGYVSDEAIAHRLEDTFTPNSCQIIRNLLSDISPTGKIFPGIQKRSRITELDQICRDGSIITTETRISYLPDSGDNGAELLGVSRDVTERKRMEEQMKHSELLASLGKMTSGIAHEVNNPLGSILLFTELIMKNDISEEVKADLKIIHDEAKRAAKVMSDLLTYSLGSSRFSEPVDILQVIDKVLDMRHYSETVRNINTVFHGPGGPLLVSADRSQLSQVFMNILLNAEDVLEDQGGGTVTVNVTVIGNWVRVTIADDGPGIPAKDLQQVFYPFYSTKGIGNGTGMGLSTCYGIVTSLGGLIKAENNASGGATITVDMPLSVE